MVTEYTKHDACARAAWSRLPLEQENGTMKFPTKRQSGRNNAPLDHGRVWGKCMGRFSCFDVFAIFQKGSRGTLIARVREYAELLMDPISEY